MKVGRTKRRLAEILRGLGYEVLPENIHSTRAGKWQRSCGAWSWFATDEDQWGYSIGSYCPMGELTRRAGKVRWEKDIFGNIEVFLTGEGDG